MSPLKVLLGACLVASCTAEVRTVKRLPMSDMLILDRKTCSEHDGLDSVFDEVTMLFNNCVSKVDAIKDGLALRPKDAWERNIIRNAVSD